MTHHRAKRDGRGRFVKAESPERGAAGDVKITSYTPADPGGWSGGGGGGGGSTVTLEVTGNGTRVVPSDWSASSQFVTGIGGGSGAPKRDQPLEYTTPRHLIRWEILGMEIGD